MININDQIVENFTQNIEYLEKYHPKVFSKLRALDSAIENNHYIQKYELLYENDYFDVLETKKSTYLYGSDSNTYAKLVTENINFETTNDTYECFHKHTITDADIITYKKDTTFKNHLSNISNILNYHQKNDKMKQPLQSLDKFVFFGVGLGLHITEVHKKISSKVYFIIENNLELFRLSLFITNYKNIAKNSQLVFSIFEESNEFQDTVNYFLEQEYYYNHYIKYFSMLNYTDNKRKELHIQIVSQPHLSFYYNDLLTQSLKPLKYMFNDYNFLDKNILFSDSKLDKANFLLLAAGPSLQSNKEWLKKNHKNFIIVAVSAILKFLEQEGITPDIIIHLEGKDASVKHFSKIHSWDFFKNSICIFSDKTSSKVIEKFSKEQIYLFENGTQYKNSSLKPSAPCVGSISYQILLVLQVKNIYLLGLDLAVDSDGNTHIDEHIKTKSISNTNSLLENDTIAYDQDLMQIEGNFDKNVYTTLHFKSSIEAINYSTKVLATKNQNIYNIGEGAKFFKSIAISLANISISKTNRDYNTHLKTILEKNKSISLSNIERESLKCKIEKTILLKNAILKIKQAEYSTQHTFLSEIKNIPSLLVNFEDTNL
ncbi:MAG: hypothetical protein DRG78_17915, partial [Epsilonproteobacteria bacterium]